MNDIISCGIERHLADYGLRIVDRDWRCAMGSVDFVCLDGSEVVLVNVKVSARPLVGGRKIPYDISVSSRRIALFYLAMHPSIEEVRFDLLTVSKNESVWQTISTYRA